MIVAALPDERPSFGRKQEQGREKKKRGELRRAEIKEEKAKRGW